MSYVKPEVKAVSLELNNKELRNFGPDKNSGCSRSCCYADGNNW